MNNLDWFGIGTPKNGMFFLSVVSLYPERLSESQFIKQPLLFCEKDEVEKRKTELYFRTFYQKYIENSCRMTWTGSSFQRSEKGYCEQHISDFLNEEELRLYVDFTSKTIFFMDSYVEILVYSFSKFHLLKIDGLFQRVKNTPVSWSETIWSV